MYEEINEKIDVIAIFGTGGHKTIKPYRIKWRNQEYLIKEIGYLHKVRDGRKVLHVFSLSDGVNFFETTFDAEDLKWVLGRVMDNEIS